MFTYGFARTTKLCTLEPFPSPHRYTQLLFPLYRWRHAQPVPVDLIDNLSLNSIVNYTHCHRQPPRRPCSVIRAGRQFAQFDPMPPPQPLRPLSARGSWWHTENCKYRILLIQLVPWGHRRCSDDIVTVPLTLSLIPARMPSRWFSCFCHLRLRSSSAWSIAWSCSCWRFSSSGSTSVLPGIFAIRSFWAPMYKMW